LQPPIAEQVREKPVGDARSDPLVDQALSMIAIVSIDEPNVVEAASPPSLDTAEAAVLSLWQPVDTPASKDVLPVERPAQQESPAVIEHTLSLVKKVVISEHKAVLVKKVVISEDETEETASPSLQPPIAEQAGEKPVGDARSDPLVDQALSMVAIVSIDEPNVVEAPQNDHAHSTVVEAAPTALKTEATVPLPHQSLMRQLPAEERLDLDLADIRRRVAVFKESQQRLRREREEFHATTMAKARPRGDVA
jgi:hypothetical protein